MKLIGSNSSPYVRKVRITMAEKKLDYQYVTENVWAAETRIGESNPLGKVPCLVMEGGEALFDSRVIVEYLENLSPVGKLIPANGRERAEVKTWEALADGVLDAAILARLEATWDGRSKAQRSQAWIDRQLAKIDASLKAMSRGLARQAVLRRHPPEPGRYRGRLCARLPGFPLPGDRLARRPPQPDQAAGQADAARQLRRYRSPS